MGECDGMNEGLICASERLDPRALNTIVDIVNRLAQCKNGGSLGPQDDWFNNVMHFPQP